MFGIRNIRFFMLSVLMAFSGLLLACGEMHSTHQKQLSNNPNASVDNSLTSSGLSQAPAQTTFSSSQLVMQLTSSEVRQIFRDQGIQAGLISSSKFSAVSLYKIEYWSPDPYGDLQLVSGGLFIPDNIKNDELLAYHHGTILPTAPAQEPSSGQGPETQGLFILASLGNIVMAADYIGYGTSASLRHPYLDVRTHASTSYHLLKAIEELKSQQPSFTTIQTQDIIPIGYSQGGAAALAFHRHVDVNSPQHNVQYGIYGSGPYDLMALLQDGWDKQNLTDNRLTAWVLDSMNEVYGLGYSNNDMFLTPYASQMDFDNYSLPTLPNNPRLVIQPDFYDEISRYLNSPMRMALDTQSLYLSWFPDAPVFIYHGQQDRVVPSVASTLLYNEFECRETDILYLKDGADHLTGIQSYLGLSLLLLHGPSQIRNTLFDMAEAKDELDLTDISSNKSFSDISTFDLLRLLFLTKL